jgi:hypothetical protein
MNTRSLVLRFGLYITMLAGGLAAVMVARIDPARIASAAPWDLVSFKRIDADPNNSYAVTESDGPWMIMVSTFHGDKAREQARQLVYELRKQNKLRAYTHARTYDYNTRHMEGKGVSPDGTPKMMKYVNAETYEEVAVLVGDFHSVDDPEGQKDLALIKHADPACLKPEATPTANSPLADLRRWGQQTFGTGKKSNGPLANAFITTNPLLPREYFVGKGVDKFILDMNKGVEYSLLDCPGHYSVKIATFTGRVEIDQQKIRQIEGSAAHDRQTDDSPLVEAAAKAHAITEFLRARKIEAYEFHDRGSSIVTVGHFDSVGSPRADGKIEINPQIFQIITAYGADQSSLAGGPATMGVKPKTVIVSVGGKKKSIVLDISPIPVEVPRRTISGVYQASTMR